jgi:hypothetical protein
MNEKERKRALNNLITASVIKKEKPYEGNVVRTKKVLHKRRGPAPR